jgi:AraC-like DNA-binding protein
MRRQRDNVPLAMTHTPTVSSVMVRALACAVEHAGGRRDQFLAAASLDPDCLDDCHMRLPLADYERAQLAALSLSGDAAFGLHMMRGLSSAEFDVLGHLTVHAATLRQALETLVRYSRIVSDVGHSLLIEEQETASIRLVQANGTVADRLFVELSMHGLLRLMRMFVGPEARPRGVFFEYDAPEYHAEYARIFEGCEHFGHAFTGIEFERAWLERSHWLKNSELCASLQVHADRALGRLIRDKPVSELVAERLADCDPAHLPTMNEVARQLGLSERSLRRRLTQERATFRNLAERAVIQEAKRRLEEPCGSIQAVASALGFATPAAFHRAFKRWTGLTPSAYKRSY